MHRREIDCLKQMNDETDDIMHECTTGEERYINPCTDFGFKKLFGTPMNKDLLISFLNALLADEQKVIADVQYLNSEHLGDGYGDRRAVFDVYCFTADGSRFIVEMQKREQEYFKDRTLFYSTYALREQAPKGKDWNYRLEDVYTVALLNFTFPECEYPADSYRHVVKLKDVEDNHVFYDKLTFVYLELPKFRKGEGEIATMSIFEKWMFVLHNLARLMERPKALQDRIFDRLFEQAEIAKYTPKERMDYVFSRKNYWDYNNTLTFSHKQGLREGMEKGMKQGLKEGKKQGLEEGKKQGLEEGKKQGLEEGKKQGLEEGKKQGLEEGKKQGLRQGALQEKADTVRRLMNMGLDLEQAARGTGLTVEEVREITN